MVDRFAEEVVGAHGAGYMIAGPVIAPGLVLLLRELDVHFELGKHVALNLERDLRSVRRGLGISHQRAQMISAEVHLIGQNKLA